MSRLRTTGAALTAFSALTLAIAVAAGLGNSVTAQDQGYIPEFTDNKELIQPPDHVWRNWPFIGTPLTPNALNGGTAPFPEFHIVYIDPVSYEHWKRTGTFREGTVLAKELTSVRAPDGANPDGSTNEVSGTGYFMGEYIGFEIAIKSAELFPDEPGHWAYYSFGHHPEPYSMAAAKQAVETCNACHGTNAADDYVFTQFYPVLRASRPE